MRIAICLVLVASVSIFAGCGDDGGSGGSGGSSSDGGGTSSSGGGQSEGGATATTSAGGEGGAGGTAACPVPDLPYEKGCLTFEGASELCGFSSDQEVCGTAAACGGEPDQGQCNINCEQGASVNCYAEADVACLVQAICDHDCAAFEACGFIL